MQSCLPRSINAAKKTSQKNGSSTIYTALPAETCNTCYVIAMCLFYLYLPLKSSEQKMFMCRLRLAWKRTKHVPLVCTFSAHFKNGGPGGAHAEKRTRSIRKARCRLWPLALLRRRLLPRPYSQSKPRNLTVEVRRESATSHNVTLRIEDRLDRAAKRARKPARVHAKSITTAHPGHGSQEGRGRAAKKR